MVEKTLTFNVPENQQAVDLRMEVEVTCTCADIPGPRAGSYIDAEPPARLSAGAGHPRK